MKYPINKEFFPYYCITAPLNPRMIQLAQKYMKTPRIIWNDQQLNIEIRVIPGFHNDSIELILFSPKDAADPAPCLVYFHGGGFVYEGSKSHFLIAMAYARQARCKVIYVRYRLAPKHPFPVPQEDCYAALCWVYNHAEELGIHPDTIGVSGDSAGGTLSVTSCLMARDRGAAVKPLFQLLVYPWLDGRNSSESNRRFTYTPMWNSTLSQKVGPIINPDLNRTPLAYRSPVEAKTFIGLPPAYIEVAEFDCLHDDGVLYTSLLRDAGIDVELHETKGTMHGFDTAINAPTSQAMLAQRIDYMKRMFASKRALLHQEASHDTKRNDLPPQILPEFYQSSGG